MYSLGAVLSARRKELGLSQQDAAEKLAALGVLVRAQNISKWETGTTQPGAAQLVALCAVYGIRDVPAAFGMRRADSHWDRLSARGRELVREYVRALDMSGLYRAESAAGKVRQLPVYQLAVSAGTGQFLDSDSYDMTECGDDVSPLADFGVRIAGDSMEPAFRDGQTVWAHRQQSLQPGDIGIFLYDGNAYCKMLGGDEGAPKLISLNRRYAPIEVRGELTVFGRVV